MLSAGDSAATTCQADIFFQANVKHITGVGITEVILLIDEDLHCDRWFHQFLNFYTKPPQA